MHNSVTTSCFKKNCPATNNEIIEAELPLNPVPGSATAAYLLSIPGAMSHSQTKPPQDLELRNEWRCHESEKYYIFPPFTRLSSSRPPNRHSAVYFRSTDGRRRGGSFNHRVQSNVRRSFLCTHRFHGSKER